MKFSIRTVLDIAASIAMLLCSGVLLWMFVIRPDPHRIKDPVVQLPKTPVAINAATSRGAENAEWAVIEFSDFQCPFCGQFARTTLPTILRDYVGTGKVRYSFRHLPAPVLHPEAELAAMAAECAGQQGKFWEMHDLLFENQTRLAAVSNLEQEFGIELDKPRFLSCMAGPRHPVNEAMAFAKALGISSTPTFLVGSLLPNGAVAVQTVITGARPVAEFNQLFSGLTNRSPR